MGTARLAVCANDSIWEINHPLRNCTSGELWRHVSPRVGIEIPRDDRALVGRPVMDRRLQRNHAPEWIFRNVIFSFPFSFRFGHIARFSCHSVATDQSISLILPIRLTSPLTDSSHLHYAGFAFKDRTELNDPFAAVNSLQLFILLWHDLLYSLVLLLKFGILILYDIPLLYMSLLTDISAFIFLHILSLLLDWKRNCGMLL